MAKKVNDSTPPKMNILAQYVRDLSFENILSQKGVDGEVNPEIQENVNMHNVTCCIHALSCQQYLREANLESIIACMVAAFLSVDMAIDMILVQLLGKPD